MNGQPDALRELFDERFKNLHGRLDTFAERLGRIEEGMDEGTAAMGKLTTQVQLLRKEACPLHEGFAAQLTTCEQQGQENTVALLLAQSHLTSTWRTLVQMGAAVIAVATLLLVAFDVL
jgi:hypothetical protein